MRFKINDRVILITNRHGIQSDNPYYKSDFACEGSVHGIHYSALNISHNIVVKWANGLINSYLSSDLKLIDPYLQNCNSIW